MLSEYVLFLNKSIQRQYKYYVSAHVTSSQTFGTYLFRDHRHNNINFEQTCN
jgi:hypothetical protein